MVLQCKTVLQVKETCSDLLGEHTLNMHKHFLKTFGQQSFYSFQMSKCSGMKQREL